jgi:hypothetical protein
MKKTILAAILLLVAIHAHAEPVENDLDGNASALQAS